MDYEKLKTKIGNRNRTPFCCSFLCWG